MTDLEATFRRLRGIVEPYVAQCHVKTDEPATVYLETTETTRQMFCAIYAKKTNVSFHYTPVYADPDLLTGMSADLRRRMQGKSCFTFKRPDDPSLAELEQLVARTAPDFLSTTSG